MQEHHREVGAHPLPETQLTREGLKKTRQIEKLRNECKILAVGLLRNSPDDLLPLEALYDGMIPPELGAVAKQDAELIHQYAALLLRRHAEDRDFSLGR